MFLDKEKRGRKVSSNGVCPKQFEFKQVEARHTMGNNDEAARKAVILTDKKAAIIYLAQVLSGCTSVL